MSGSIESKEDTQRRIEQTIDRDIKPENINLFLSAKKIVGKYVNTSGSITDNATAEMVSFAVKAGETYALQSPSYNSASFYAAYSDTENPVVRVTLGLVAFSNSTTQLGVKIFTVPAGASYVYLNTLLPSMGFDIRSGVLINLGSEAKEASISKIKDANIIDLSAVKTTDLNITAPLYSASNNINSQFVRYTTGNIETSASATVMNVFPVEAGKTYTVYSPSYANGYFAIAFRDSAVSSNGPTMAFATLVGSGDTRTFVVPEGVTHAFMNVVIPVGGFDISTTVKVNKGTSIVSESLITQISGSSLVDEQARLEIEKIKNETIISSPLTGKKWAVIGDSITHKNDRSRFNYHYYLAQGVGGMTVYNYGVSGSGFFSRHAVADTITQAEVDLITVFLGTNDWGNQTTANQKELGVFGDTGTTTISGCINTLLTGLINKFPIIPIAIFTPLPRATNYGLNAPDNAYGYNLKDLVDLLHEYATHYSLPILDLYTISNLYPWLPASNEYYFKPFEGSSYGTNPDGLHPNDAGHMLLARKMKSFLESI